MLGPDFAIDGGVRTARGDEIFPSPRFEHDRHVTCPLCEADEPWACAIVEAYIWTRRGGALADVRADASAAVVEGVLLVGTEADALEAQRIRDRHPG